MYGYFSNYRYEPNFTKAKCQQEELTVKRGIMNYELSPLKNIESAGRVVRTAIIPKYANLSLRADQVKTSFNSWSFLAIFAGMHIYRMRFLKKNLSEMNLPLYHIYTCFVWSFLINCPLSYAFSENFKSKNEVLKARKSVYDLERDFAKAYFVPLLAEEVKKEVMKLKAEAEKKN